MNVYRETSFRGTQVGEIPSDWRVVPLTEIGKVKSGKRVPKEEKLVNFKTPFPYLRIVDFKNSTIDSTNLKYLLPSTYEKIKKYKISSDDVYLSIAGTIGLVGLVPRELDGANLTENAAKLCELKNVQKEFLSYMLRSQVLQKQIKSLVGKGTQPKLALFRIEKLRIPLPPPCEQSAIVHVLSVVDDAIRKTSEIIAKTKRLKKGLMQELLVKGIGHEEFKSTEIGKIPKSWEVARLGDVADINPESADPGARFPEKTFRYIDIESVEEGRIRGAKSVRGRDAPSRARRIIRENDVIMSTVRPYLRAFAMVPKEYDGEVCSTGFAVLRCRERIHCYFIFYAILSDIVINQCKTMMIGGQYPALNESQVVTIKIPLPQITEQKLIAEILYAVYTKQELETTEKAKLERIKEGLMDLLLTGKVRVKVD